MLEAAREEPGALDPYGRAVGGDPLDDRAVETDRARLQAGQRQAALGAAELVPVGRHQARVDDVPDVAHVLVVGAVVHEHPLPDADLVRGEADALGGVHRREHVLDEPVEGRAESGDLRALRVEHRVAQQAHGADEAGGTGDGALSHGRKGTTGEYMRRSAAPWGAAVKAPAGTG